MIPMLCVLIFSIVGTWMMIDPLPGDIILHFPELVGRLTFMLWYRIVATRFVFNIHTKIMPVRSIMYYADLIDEAKLMAETPIGGYD